MINKDPRTESRDLETIIAETTFLCLDHVARISHLSIGKDSKAIHQSIY